MVMHTYTLHWYIYRQVQRSWLQAAPGSSLASAHSEHPTLHYPRRALQAKGLETCLVPATLAGGLRGLAPAKQVAPGECVLQLPASELITYQTALQSDLVRAW
jgi:hypothetical protein